MPVLIVTWLTVHTSQRVRGTVLRRRFRPPRIDGVVNSRPLRRVASGTARGAKVRWPLDSRHTV